MHIWTINSWEKNLQERNLRRTGIRFRYEKSVNIEVKQAFFNFASWVRTEYEFPLRLPVYVKGTKTIRTKDGDNVVGSFFEPFSYTDEPYIRIATGDYEELTHSEGKENAIAILLLSLTHEITHYYQWINNIQLTDLGRERQATRYAKLILYEYFSMDQSGNGSKPLKKSPD